ncbi:MAG: hypothetical protein EZS28_007133 [Streblomastix strix]|uniref:Uncharacterized protein n=1 Tax=Streblomastix strix TaxID=222440 RepID=A0A5J4WQB2_9EUKA|nr:MAG: hypothetical protein EZS28_007133 [Streblomastix strix]
MSASFFFPISIRKSSRRKDALFSIDIHPDDSCFVTAGNSLDLWDFEAVLNCNKENDDKVDKLICSLQGHKGSINCVRFAPNGNLLASCGTSDPGIFVWAPNIQSSIEQSQQLNSVGLKSKDAKWTLCYRGTIHGHNRDIQDMCWSSDSQSVFTCGQDLQVIKWNIPSFNEGINKNQNSYSQIAHSPGPNIPHRLNVQIVWRVSLDPNVGMLKGLALDPKEGICLAVQGEHAIILINSYNGQLMNDQLNDGDIIMNRDILTIKSPKHQQISSSNFITSSAYSQQTFQSIQHPDLNRSSSNIQQQSQLPYSDIFTQQSASSIQQSQSQQQSTIARQLPITQQSSITSFLTHRTDQIDFCRLSWFPDGSKLVGVGGKTDVFTIDEKEMEQWDVEEEYEDDDEY